MKPCDIKELRGVIKGLVGNAGDGVWAGGSTLHRDALGSVRAVTTAAGLKAERATYRPYGEQTEASFDIATAAETKGFIGERFDADAGLQYLNARYYDPKLAMFLQLDWWEVTKAGVGTNRYGYAGGDPVNGKDPSGHKTFGETVREFFKAVGDALGVSREARDRYEAKQVYYAQSNINQLNRDFTAGRVSATDYQYRLGVQEQLRDNSLTRIDRSNLGLLSEFGLEYGAVAIGSLAGRIIGSGASKASSGAYEVAKAGGKHAGFLKNYVGRAPAEIEKAIASIEKQIVDHKSWIEKPSTKIQNFESLDARQQAALVGSK